MFFAQDRSNPYWVGDSPTDLNAFRRGLEYLHAMQDLALEPEMVNLLESVRDRATILTWIGKNIDAVNAILQQCLLACHDCFHPQERRSMQIFAVPLAQSLGLDGLCNIATNPITILIDVGRVAPDGWLSIVAHEYAHAHIASPGHHPSFAVVLSHLCLGLGLHSPDESTEWTLRSWPPYTPTLTPLAFWRGELGGMRTETVRPSFVSNC